MLPKGLAAAIDTGSWKVPPLFEMLRHIGQVPEDDWRRTFNLGVGMIFVVLRSKMETAQRALKRAGEKPWIIGEDREAAARQGPGGVPVSVLRLGILISGRGSNFEAISQQHRPA